MPKQGIPSQGPIDRVRVKLQTVRIQDFRLTGDTNQTVGHIVDMMLDDAVNAEVYPNQLTIVLNPDYDWVMP